MLSAFARVFGIDPLARSAQRAYRGALAELEVVRVLGSLDASWTVLHSVPVDDEAVVDHLAIGPAGVFAIGTRNHAGQRVWVGERTFMVDDERVDCLAGADALAAAVSRRLSAASGVALQAGTVFAAGPEGLVTPCIVIDAPGELVIHQRPARTEVATSRTFGPWLTALPRLLSPAVVTALSAAALAGDTWVVAGASADASSELREFDRLHRRVTASRVRRLLWAGLGVVLSYGTMIASLGGLTLFGLVTASLGR